MYPPAKPGALIDGRLKGARKLEAAQLFTFAILNDQKQFPSLITAFSLQEALRLNSHAIARAYDDTEPDLTQNRLDVTVERPL